MARMTTDVLSRRGACQLRSSVWGCVAVLPGGPGGARGGTRCARPGRGAGRGALAGVCPRAGSAPSSAPTPSGAPPQPAVLPAPGRGRCRRRSPHRLSRSASGGRFGLSFVTCHEVGLARAFETQTLSVSGPERGSRRSWTVSPPHPHHGTSGMLWALLGGQLLLQGWRFRPGWGSVLWPPPTVVSVTLEVLTVQGPSPPSQLPRLCRCGLGPGNVLWWGPSGTELGQEAGPDAGSLRRGPLPACSTVRAPAECEPGQAGRAGRGHARGRRCQARERGPPRVLPFHAG